MPTWEDLLSTPYGKATPEQIKRAQEHAYALLKPRETPNRSWASPIADVMQALQGHSMLNRSTMGGYDQRQQESGDLRDALIQMRGGQTPPLTTGSLPSPQQTAALQPQAAPPEITPDDGAKIPLPTQSPTITGTGNPTEQPKTGFKLDSYIKRLFEVESGNNPAARKGSYRGLAQFSPDLEKKYGINDENWQDPTVQINAAARHAIESSQEFKRKFGHDPSEGEMYLMHQQGVNGGTALLGSSPNAPAYKTLAEASGASEAVAKQRVASNIPTGSELSKKPVENITNQEFSRLWVNKFDKGETSPYQTMRLGGPTEETTPTATEGTQVAQANGIPPALPSPTSRIDPSTLQRLLGGAGHAVTDDQKEMITKMMMEGAQPKDRNTAGGPQQYDPNNPAGMTSMPGQQQLIPFSVGKINTHGLVTITPQGPKLNILVPGKTSNGGWGTIDELAERSRQMEAEDARVVGGATGETEHYTKLYPSIKAVGRQARDENNQLTKAEQLVNDPKFISGSMDEQRLKIRQFLDYATGEDPGDAAATQAFVKLIAGTSLANIQKLGGMGLGQVRNPEIKLIEQMNANTNLDRGAIRAIIDINKRVNNRLMEVSSEASKYRQEKNRLDPGFEEHLDKLVQDKPLFNDDEIKDYRALFNKKGTSVDLEKKANLPSAATPDEARKLGKGMRFRMPDGSVGVVP